MMMQRLNTQMIQEALISARDEPCVSLYLSNPRAPLQDFQIRFKKLLGEASELLDKTYGEKTRHDLLNSFHDFQPEMAPRARGIAFFRSATLNGFVPLQEEPKDVAVVSNSFHIKPMVNLVQGREKYLIAHFQKDRIKLFEGNSERVRFVTNISRAGSGPQPVRLDRESKDRVSKKRPQMMPFMKQAKKVIEQRMDGQRMPLILSGSEQMRNLFFDLFKFPQLLQRDLRVHIDQESLDEIHARIWPEVRSIFEGKEDDLLDEFGTFLSKGFATDDLAAVAKAAVEGRIQILFIAKGVTLWGVLNRNSGEFELHERQEDGFDDDILDDIGEEVMRRRGQTFAVDLRRMPTKSPVAAVLRW